MMYANEHPAIRKMVAKMQIKRHSKATIDSYVAWIRKIIAHYQNTNPSRITDQMIESFLFNQLTNGIGYSNQNVCVNAIRKWQFLCFNRKRNYNHLRPQKPKYLPKPIPNEQFYKGLSKITNEKHRIMCILMFCCGFRRQELINCELSWFNKYDKTIRITGKGDKQREVPYSNEVKKELRAYFLKFRPKKYLLEGQSKEKYSGTSIENIVKKNIGCSPHKLRHNYATNRVHNGTNLIILQRLLGHASPKTTEIYTKVNLKEITNIYIPELCA